jgi:hypothetical protein
MNVAHMLKPAKIIDLDAAHLLPEAKHVPLLGIPSRSGFEDCTPFPGQRSFVLMTLKDYPPKLVTCHNLARIFQCKVGSIEWQVSRVSGLAHPIGCPQLLTSEAHLVITRLVNDAYTKRQPVSIVYLIGQIQYFFDITVSQNTMAHIIRNMPAVKMITGIPMDKDRVMANPKAIDDFYLNISTLIKGILRSFIVNMDGSGFSDCPEAQRETVVAPQITPAIRSRFHWTATQRG